MRHCMLLVPACALAVTFGCGPMTVPLPQRLDPESQKIIDDGWSRTLTPPDKLGHQDLLDVLVGTQAYQLGVDSFMFRAEKRYAGGKVVMEVAYDRARPDDDRFQVTVIDSAGKVSPSGELHAQGSRRRLTTLCSPTRRMRPVKPDRGDRTALGENTRRTFPSPRKERPKKHQNRDRRDNRIASVLTDAPTRPAGVYRRVVFVYRLALQKIHNRAEFIQVTRRGGRSRSTRSSSMSRRVTVLLLGAALLTASAGCRSSCGSAPGWFTSHTRGEAPCQLTGAGNVTGGCFDPVTGRPVPCPPADSTILIPGGTAPPGVAPRPDELPYPSPGDMIRPPGVPFAPPQPAPGMEGTGMSPKSGAAAKGNTVKQ